MFKPRSKATTKKITLLALSIFLFSSSFVYPTFASSITSTEVIKLVNQSRKENKLETLTESKHLDKVAFDKAYDMIENDYFAHTSPNNITPWYWFEKNNYTYKYAGENLAINYSTAIEQHSAWMNSTTHRQNILDPNFTETGVATLSGEMNEKNVLVTVQVFAQPKAIPILGATQATSVSSNTEIATKSEILGTSFVSSIKLDPKKTTLDSTKTSLAPKTDTIKDNSGNQLISEEFKKETTKNILLLLSVISIMVILHISVLASINPRKISHLSSVNVAVAIIAFSVLS